MSEIHQQILALTEERRKCQAQVDRRNDLQKLAENPEFKKIIREDFMVHDCARFVMQSVDPTLQEDNRADALAKAQAAGHLKQYLNVIILQGNTSENTVKEIDEALAELRALDNSDDVVEDA